MACAGCIYIYVTHNYATIITNEEYIMPLGRSKGDREMEMIWTDHSCMKPGKISTIKQTLKRTWEKLWLYMQNVLENCRNRCLWKPIYRIVAKLKLFHMKHGELFSLSQESTQELCALGTELRRQTRVSFFLCRAHLLPCISGETFVSSIYLPFLHVYKFSQCFWTLPLESVLSKLYTFIDVL